MPFFCGVSCNPNVGDEWQLELAEDDPSGETLVLRPAPFWEPQCRRRAKIASSAKAQRNVDELSEDSRSTAADETSVGQSESASETTTAELEGFPSTEALRPARQHAEGDWWEPVKPESTSGLRDAIPITQLLEARVVKHASNAQSSPPWLQKSSEGLYCDMGLDDAQHDSLALWLNVGTASLVFACAVTNQVRLQDCLADNPLGVRLKLIVSPVKATLPLPCKSPRDAESIRNFFGSSCSSLTSMKNSVGRDICCLQVDLFSKWMLRMALQNVAFRPDNIVDLIIVDWAEHVGKEPGILASVRLTVTHEFLRLMA
jgi:hypothetical protein